MTCPTFHVADLHEALRAIRAARPLGQSALLTLATLADAVGAELVADSPAGRAAFLPRWLGDIVSDQLARARNHASPASPDSRAARALSNGDLAADFLAGDTDREAWASLHAYYFTGRNSTLHQLAAGLPVGFNTLRRRIDRGLELLADLLTEREREASAAHDLNHRLPQPTTRFIGREAELGAVRQLLARHPVVVLTGPAGIGKSRLAIRLAQDLGADYPDGAWFVEAASLADGRLLPQAVRLALELPETVGCADLDLVAHHLADQRLLLVLDNCEHLAAAASLLIARLTAADQALQVLATSHEALAVDGAAHWPLPKMAMPAHASPATASSLMHYDAPRLFSARAAVAAGAFQLTDANAAEVSAICARLDGLPLAIELAAALIRQMPLADLDLGLAERLARRPDGQAAERPAEDTLQAILAWSYGCLTSPEQRLFRRLAVFPGIWTPGMAEDVGLGEGFNAADISSLLDQLATKAFVDRLDSPDGDRFRMLAPVRQFLRQRLDASDMAPPVAA